MTTAQLRKLLTVPKNVRLNSERHVALRHEFAHLGLTFGSATLTGQRMPYLQLQGRTPVELVLLYEALARVLPALRPQHSGNRVLSMDLAPTHGEGVYGLEVEPTGRTVWTLMVHCSTWPQKTYPTLAHAIWQLGFAHLDAARTSQEVTLTAGS